MSTAIIHTNAKRDCRERERERECDQDQDNASLNAHARKKMRSSIHSSSISPPPLPTYTLEDHLHHPRTPNHPSVSVSVSQPNHPSVSVSQLNTHVTVDAPSSPSTSTSNTATTITPISTSTRAKSIQTQTSTQQKSSQPLTPIYTIDDFITRFACKMQFLDFSIKTQMHKIEAAKNDPAQEQRCRDLHSGLATLEAKARAVEEKIEDLFRLKIGK